MFTHVESTFTKIANMLSKTISIKLIISLLCSPRYWAKYVLFYYAFCTWLITPNKYNNVKHLTACILITIYVCMWAIVWHEYNKESSYSVCRLCRPDSSSYCMLQKDWMTHQKRLFLFTLNTSVKIIISMGYYYYAILLWYNYGN